MTSVKFLSIAIFSAFALTACEKPAPATSAPATKEVTADKATTNASTTTTSTTAPTVKDGKTISVAIDPYYPPFEYREADGSLVGFDVDLLNAIAQKEGFNVNYQQHKILTIVDTVQAGGEDMGASSIFILPERQAVIDYSNSYFSLPLVMAGFEKEDRPKNVEEVKNQRISVQKDIVMETIVDRDFVPKGNTKLAEKSNFLAFKDVLDAKSDMILDNIVTLKGLANDNKANNLYYLPMGVSKDLQLGYVVKKGNTELLNKLNHGIEAVKADGTYQKIYDKWFGASSKYAIGDMKVATSGTATPSSAVKP